MYLKRLSKSSSIELALNIHFDVFLLLQMVWDNFQYISLNGKEDQIINALISYIGWKKKCMIHICIDMQYPSPYLYFYNNGVPFFVGEIQFKKSLKEWIFWPKMWFYLWTKTQKITFEKGWGCIQEWGCIQAVIASIYLITGDVMLLTLRPNNWLIAADSLSVHSAWTTGLISFMYSMNAFRGFLIWVSFFLSKIKRGRVINIFSCLCSTA